MSQEKQNLIDKFKFDLKQNQNRLKIMRSYLINNGVSKIQEYCCKLPTDVDLETEKRIETHPTMTWMRSLYKEL